MDATRRIVTLLIVLATMILPSTRTWAQYREESGALEQIYESRARVALNTMLRPQDYSIVVAADIEKDAKRLEKIEEDMNQMNLPGVPGLQLSENLPIANKLHELRNRIDVHLILSPLIPAEKEETAKALIKMKLHLDESAGDTLTVSRTLSTTEEARSAELLPELSWRMWTLLFLIALFGTGMILYFASKRKSSAPDQALPIPLMPSSMLGEEKDEEPAATATEATAAPSMDHQKDLVELYERKKSLVALATQYPEAASAALAEHFAKGHEADLLLTCESMGWELSKKVFRDLSHRVWAKLGVMISERKKDPEVSEVLEAVKNCHQIVVGRYLDLVDGDESNPFAFLTRLNEKDRNRLLRDEPTESLAVLCATSPRDQVASVLAMIDENSRESVLLHLARLKEIPAEALRSSADKLRQKFKAFQENPSVEMDGLKMTLDLLEELEPQAERQFVQSLKDKHPKDFEMVRRERLQFEDIAFVPSEILSDACSLLDLKILALGVGTEDSDVRSMIFASLPPKRAKMLEKDIAYLKEVSPTDVLLSRRQIARTVMSILGSKSMKPGQLIERAAADSVSLREVA